MARFAKSMFSTAVTEAGVVATDDALDALDELTPIELLDELTLLELAEILLVEDVAADDCAAAVAAAEVCASPPPHPTSIREIPSDSTHRHWDICRSIKLNVQRRGDIDNATSVDEFIIILLLEAISQSIDTRG